MDEQDVEPAHDEDNDIRPELDNLIQRAEHLLSELEAFRDRLRYLRQEGTVEFGQCRGTIRSELNMLKKLREKPNDVKAGHIARSSNLPFLEQVWMIVKKSTSVTSLQKRVYPSSSVKSLSQGMRQVNLNGTRPNAKTNKESCVIVDAISEGGRVWSKLSLVTNSRLLFDLAKQGWESGGSEADEEDCPVPADGDDDYDVPLVRSAKQLTRAAACFRVRTKTPQVHLVLPRIQPGVTPEVDAILEKCRATGAVLLCGEDPQPTPAIQDALQTMLPDPMESFSTVLNIDCTILLALVSEFSHAKVSKEPWFHTALRRQVDIEDNENLLPSLLYPALKEHQLVCTKEAAKRMREIVKTIGTPSEKARTAILMGDDPSKTQSELVQEMQEWSAYEVPTGWLLPIRIVDSLGPESQSSLPPEALEIGKSMTDINKSVFLYGWATGYTTITSNRSVVKQIEADLEKRIDGDDVVWPHIWLCPTARSLVGKEKRGAKKEDRKEGGAWPLPDPLRREHQRRNGLDVLSKRVGHEVEDLRPNGYPCDDVIEAKNASTR